MGSERVRLMFQRILPAVDGSEHSFRAVPVAGDLARRYEGEVIVLHVREHEVTWGADIDIETDPEATKLVDDVVRELKGQETNVRGEVVRVPLAAEGHRRHRAPRRSGPDRDGLARALGVGSLAHGERRGQGHAPRRVPGARRQVALHRNGLGDFCARPA